MRNFTIVGLPDTSVKESRDRIRAALKNTGFPFPRGRVTINLAPADLRKQGPLYDLPIALSILVSRGEIPAQALEHAVVLGELALDGSIRSVRGVLTTALMARRIQKQSIFVPKENEQEAAVIKELEVFGASTLRELIDHLLHRTQIAKTIYLRRECIQQNEHCFSYIKGQDLAKRGLEIAAAGGHNILLSGPPGTGKTLLAKSFPSILPPLTEEESMEVTSIASIAGELTSSSGLIEERPFRSPHHSASAVSLVGGGTWPTPGEISLAHRGVLFLDELPEFPRHVLEHLRGPLEDGVVTISRAQATVKFPARFLLIAAMNPCPCGYASDPKRRCVCTTMQLQNYQKRVSGPLLDRFDLRIEVSNLSQELLLSEVRSETSSSILTRVIAARKKQADRFFDSACHLNAEISPALLEHVCFLTPDAKTLLALAIESQSLSPRAASRVRKVARTIADLANSQTIEEHHLAEALQFRGQKMQRE
ncbi:MAG: YifB family Mg chelatase-like AAA ATPase [Candidatus Uhrbacteria bacterium]|nr:YifB family Mg chelatase-like AAA ATPase [Candidatus Uhrbacteria bacterium]